MNAAGRLAVYGAGLVVAFAGAFGAATVLAPHGASQRVPQEEHHMQDEGSGTMNGHDMTAMAADTVKGVSLSADGLVLSPVQAPSAVGTEGVLSYRVETEGGEPVTAFTETHERDMHLIVVRTDGAGFRHVHPTLDATSGTWSIPWSWRQAGTYRVYADFQSAAGTAATLSRTVEVAGEQTPSDPQPSRVSETDGYRVVLDGDLVAGSSSELTLTVSEGGRPVTALQPYLGAFGHLVALRQGDLAFLHVHPEGEEPAAGAHGGPRITFAAAVPTSGRYLLYFDFQVDGSVHTATFVVDAAHGSASGSHAH